jgi:hypothetical protein
MRAACGGAPRWPNTARPQPPGTGARPRRPGPRRGRKLGLGGATCLGPDYRRCLVSLSRGGADATVVREFDTVDKRFVDGGFACPKPRAMSTWIDADTLYVGTDFGPGSLTDAGYPRVIKRWQRGQPLADAVTVFEAEPHDVAVYAWVDHTPGFERTVLRAARSPTSTPPSSSCCRARQMQPLDKPEDAKLTFWRDRGAAPAAQRLGGGRPDLAARQPAGGRCGGLPAGVTPQLTPLFTPTPRVAGRLHRHAQHAMLNVLDKVASRLEEWRPADGAWQRRERGRAAPWQACRCRPCTTRCCPTMRWPRPTGCRRPTSCTRLAAMGPHRQRRRARPSSPRRPSSTPPACASSSALPPAATARACPTSWSGPRAPAPTAEPHAALRLRRLRGVDDALVQRRVGRTGWRGRGLRAGQHPRRRRVRPGLAPGRREAHKQKSYDDFAAVAEDLIAHGSPRPPTWASRAAATAACWWAR